MEISDGQIADAELSQAQEINELAACMNGLNSELANEEEEEDEEEELSDSVSQYRDILPHFTLLR